MPVQPGSLLRPLTLHAALLLAVSLFAPAVRSACGQDAPACPTSIRGTPAHSWFADELWAKVGRLKCLRCHRAGGDAADTAFVLQDPAASLDSSPQQILQHNLLAFTAAARLESDGHSLLLQKPLGELEHGGGSVLTADSTAHRLLVEFHSRVHAAPAAQNTPEQSPASAPQDVLTVARQPFFAGVTLANDQQVLRKAALSLAGRLPTDTELQQVAAGGRQALAEIILQLQYEEPYYQRLREAFNDIFLLLGVDGNPDSTVLSYEHFEKTRLWYQNHDLTQIADENERRQAGYRLANEYRQALLEEPLRLIEHIVRSERPFSEILTADYIMVSAYSARGYGVYDQLRPQFKNPDDPLEFLPVRLQALVGRNKSENQESASGFYPHAGLLSTFQYLSRYPTTETNRNRLRARMFYLHFLGVDVLELAARGSDAAAATARYPIPTMQAAECVVCHQTLDPVAGMFQDYWRFDANFSIYGRRKEGWFTDMFSAGFEGETLPPEDRWRALQWLAERTVRDPRFARTMAGHAWQMLTGRRPLQPPQDIDDPLFGAKLRAWEQQQCELDTISRRFIADGMNFRHLIRDWVLSDFYRAESLQSPDVTEERLAELADIGVVRLLSPEQLERKIVAVFGRPWGRLNEQTAMLYGGIDSKEVTERAVDPSGAMGAIQRTLANDVACRNTALDFSRPPTERLLFPDIEPDVVPGRTAAADARIRQTIAGLHQRILGRSDAVDSPEVQQTFQLFSAVVADAAATGRFEPQEIWHCRQGLQGPVPDPHYTVRAWRAVITYLLRQPEFLYE